MNDLKKLLSDYLDKLPLTDLDRKEIESNLLTSIYLDYLSEAIKSNKDLVNKYPINKDVSFEEFEKTINNIKSDLQESGFDFDEVLKKSTQTVLDNFTSHLQNDPHL